MPGYHSEWNEANQPTLCGMGVTPITTKFKGPAPTNVPKDKPDIIDEALKFFKANVLFRNFELLGAADKTLVYLTLFISEALQKLGNQDIESAKKEMYSLSIQEFWVPGHASWPLAGFTTAPASRAEQEQVRQWLAQLRQECGVRLCDLVFAKDKNKPDKWWMCFKTKKFMNKTLYDEGRK